MKFTTNKSGLTVEKNSIESYHHHDKESKKSRYLYLMAGVHGDEVEGVYVLEQLFDWIKTEDLKLSIVVIPILNVDGYRARTRTNSHGVDLNRNLPSSDWSGEVSEKKYYPGKKPLSEPENAYLAQLIKKYPPYFMISFHSWKPVINYNGNSKNVADFLSSYNKYPVISDIGYPTPGSLGNYLPELSNTPVITFECPPLSEDKSLKDIWEENEVGLKQLLKSDLIKEGDF